MRTIHGMPVDHGGPIDKPFEPFPYEALEASIPERLAEVVRRHGARMAVQDASRSLTYEQLGELTSGVASSLRPLLEGRPGPVALVLGNDARLPPAIFGTLAAGRPFVPLDPTHPVDRNRLIAAHAGAAAVITDGAVAGAVAGAFGSATPVVSIDAALAHAPDSPWLHVSPGELAYVLYTSGSTGQPKGVCHTHRNGLHDALIIINNAHQSCDDRIGVFYGGVIGAMRRIFSTLLNGSSLHMLRPVELEAEGLVEQIRSRGLTAYHGVPTLFRRIAAVVPDGERLETLRVVRLSGDRSEWADYDLFRKVCPPNASFGVTLGSTEVSCTYANWYVDPSLREPGARLPVGRETDDVRVEVIDDEGRVVPDGEAGEFRVSSRYISTGYWDAPELTAAAFATDPADPEIRTFLTGDIGFRRPDGLLEHVGRKDQMVKLRGHRIEPAELETALRACSGVADAAVVIRLNDNGSARAMVAYVELQPGEDTLLPRHLMAQISRVLPAYLMPGAISTMRKLPRLMNFKIDRASLTQIDARRVSDELGRAKDEVLDRVASAFEAVVPGVRATPEDNLLSLGGDSLQAVQLALELERRFAFAPPAKVIRQSQSIRELAEWMKRRLPKEAKPG